MKNQIILHRAFGSVYAQKTMCVLGYAGANWHSVMTSEGLPRPVLETLVGSFARRPPVLQIGADLYCDTDMIMMALSKQLNQPDLNRLTLSECENQQILAFDSELFYAVQGSISKRQFATRFFRKFGVKKAFTFFKDRLTMRNSKQAQQLITGKSQEQWKAIVEKHFAQMQRQLENVPFLSGKNTPNAVDFSAFTQVFYMDFLNDLIDAKNYSEVGAWYQRMTAFGLGNFSEITAEKSIEIAKNTEPTPIPETLQTSDRLGEEIEVPYNDSLGKLIVEPLKAILVGEDDFQYIIERKNEAIGKVHIHIPKQCYGACG